MKAAGIEELVTGMRTGAALNNQDRGKDWGVIATKRATESVPSNPVAALEKRATELNPRQVGLPLRQIRLEELVTAMRADSRHAEDAVDCDDAKLTAMGWSGRAARTALEMPGQTRAIEAPSRWFPR